MCVSSFYDKIEHNEPPIKFSAPEFFDYQGRKDPITHVLHFKTTMALVSLTLDKRDAMICKLFATSLCDGEQNWFNNLTPRTVTSFA